MRRAGSGSGILAHNTNRAISAPLSGMMSTTILARAGMMAGLAVTVLGEPDMSAGAQRTTSPLASIKQWNAEVIVTSDCDGVAIDGTRTLIHNRIVTTYELTRR